jgi:serine/threonine protein kinase
MNIHSSDNNEDNNEDGGVSPPPPSPVITRRLFNLDIDETIIKGDYELQDLLKTMHIYQIDVTNVILESRIENALRDMPDATDIMKIKVKLLYIIIANNIYRSLFEEKKQYRSIKTTQYIGVFRYNDYIIRIDESPYSFISEEEVVRASSAFKDATDANDECIHKNIIRPFLIYTNIRRNIKNEFCDCRPDTCVCKYADDEYSGRDDDIVSHRNDVSRLCYKKLRQNTISFSIQHYVKDTTSLYHWVRDNLGNHAYNRFSSIQHSFFVNLFYKCALLLREIHSINIVHGDIKPDNILIREHDNFNIDHPERCKNFTVYLIDFGLSGIHNVGVGTGGTIPYCHPEFKNIIDTNRSSKYHWKTVHVKHDVWSLGIAFLTMYIYRDFYNYYHKYPNYFFMKDGYVSPLILDVITHNKVNQLFTKLMSSDCIPIHEVCDLLQEMTS